MLFVHRWILGAKAAAVCSGMNEWNGPARKHAERKALMAAPAILESVSGFLGERHDLLIGGSWVPAASGESFAVENPSSEENIAQVARGGAEDIDRAVKAARTAFEGVAWSRMNPSERGQLLWREAAVGVPRS